MRLALGAEHHLFYTADEVVLRHRFAVLPCRQNRALVHKAREVRAAKARRALGDDLQVYVLGERLFARVDFKDFEAIGAVGQVDGDTPIKAAGAQERRVEHVGAVGRRHDYHLFVRLKAVHLHQNLIECLLALVVAAAHAGAAHPADRVYFVDKYYRGRRLFGRQKEVAYARGAYADKHLHKFRA